MIQKRKQHCYGHTNWQMQSMQPSCMLNIKRSYQLSGQKTGFSGLVTYFSLFSKTIGKMEITPPSLQREHAPKRAT